MVIFMNTFLRKVIPQAFILTCITMIWTAFYNIAVNSETKGLYIRFLFMVVCFCIGSVVDSLMQRYLESQKPAVHYTISFIAWFTVVGTFLFVSGWMGFNLRSLALYAVLFMIVFFGMDKYNKYQLRKDVEEMNRLLERRRGESSDLY